MYRMKLKSRKKRLHRWMTQIPKSSTGLPLAMPMEPSFLDAFVIDYNPVEFPEIAFGSESCLQSLWDQRYAS